MNAKPIWILFFVVLTFARPSQAQPYLGRGEIKSFTRLQYGAGSQNWAIAQDKQNRLYIANNEGLLVFNGTNWQTFPVLNNTILRCIAFGEDEKLYAGAQDELGYYAPDEAGILRYTSLKNLLPGSEQKFNDIWQVQVVGKEVFFRSDSKIYVLSNGKFSIFPSASSWISMQQFRGKLIAQDKSAGLMEYQQGRWQNLLNKENLPTGFQLSGLIPFKNDTCLLSSSNSGLYFFNGNKIWPFSVGSNAQNITSISLLDSNSFIAGTYFNGIYRISKSGQVLENISAAEGLPNNTVRCVFADKSGNVWMGLDNGIAGYSFNNIIRQITPAAFKNGVGYDAKSINGDLYFALSTGIFWLPINGADDLSKLSPNVQSIRSGLSWDLSSINNRLFAGRDDGFFEITNHQAKNMTETPGFWTAKSLGNDVVAGNYLGLHLYQNQNGSIVDKGKFDGFNESSRYVETEGQVVWVSHPYRGVYKIDLVTNKVKLYTQVNGFPANLENQVFKIRNTVLFATTKGIYEYDQSIDKMRFSKMYSNIFGQKPIRYLKEDDKGNVWFVEDKMVGVVNYSGGQPAVHYIPELKNKILSGFENIFPYNGNNIIIGSESGFYHLNYEKYREALQPFGSYITQVKTIGVVDSVLFGGFGGDERQHNIVVPYKWNGLRLSYAATILNLSAPLEYSCYLKGFDKTWSEWSTAPQKDYTNIPPGNYVFFVKSRLSPTHVSDEYQLEIKVLPPWYRTIWAYLLYAVLLISLLYALLKYQSAKYKKHQEEKRRADQQKFEEQQRQTEYAHQLELEKSEKELARYQNEILQAEITHKNAELASTAMNLVQKKEFILKLKDELQKLQKSSKVEESSTELKKLLKVLNEEEKLNEEWEHFSRHFDSVHGDFISTLKQKFPTLKAHELKLCAYLRMDLSSKEIAPLMSISVRGVEISRYRLRKKLNLSTEENLVDFLVGL